MRGEQTSFFPPDIQKLHKQVEKELGRIEGEDWDEFQENVRQEVNARLQEFYKNYPKPHYKDVDFVKKVYYNNIRNH